MNIDSGQDLTLSSSSPPVTVEACNICKENSFPHEPIFFVSIAGRCYAFDIFPRRRHKHRLPTRLKLKQKQQEKQLEQQERKPDSVLSEGSVNNNNNE